MSDDAFLLLWLIVGNLGVWGLATVDAFLWWKRNRRRRDP